MGNSNRLLREKFRVLVELFYDKECSDDDTLDIIADSTKDFFELRRGLFNVWIEMVLDAAEFLTLGDVEDAAHFYWRKNFSEKGADIVDQEKLFCRDIDEIDKRKGGIIISAFFLLGVLKLEPSSDLVLYKNFTLNLFHTDKFVGREIVAKKSFFSSLSKHNCKLGREINLLFSPGLGDSSGHVRAMSTNNRLRWVTISGLVPSKLGRKILQRNVQAEEFYPGDMVINATPVPVPVLVGDENSESSIGEKRKCFTRDTLSNQWNIEKYHILMLHKLPEYGSFIVETAKK